MSQEVFEALTRALERGEDAALVTIVSANGSTPQRVGAKMLVFPDGDLTLVRNMLSLAGVGVLLFGFIWDLER